MIALRILATAALFTVSHAHAIVLTPTPGVPGLAPTAQAQPPGGIKIAPRPVTLLPPKITSFAISSPKILTGQVMDMAVGGEGTACNYYLWLTHPDSGQEWQVPKISTFPAVQTFSLDLNQVQDQYPHGKFKVKVQAKAGDLRPGVLCQGGSQELPFTRERVKVSAPADAPRIVDILLKPSTKMEGANRYRVDEELKFTVVGSVDNTNDPTKQCVYSVWLEDKSKNNVLKGSLRMSIGHFNIPIVLELKTLNTQSFLTTGTYTLRVQSTKADISANNVSCLGSVSKTIEVFRPAGRIEGLALLTEYFGTLVIQPQIIGPTCQYKITRIINDGQSPTITTTHFHVEGKPDILPVEHHTDDKTKIYVSMEPVSNQMYETASCSGTANKTANVYKDKAGSAY